MIAEEELYDGLYVIKSDVPGDCMDINEVVNAYKSLSGVEQAFKNLKTVHLETRPMNHKTDKRIKAHVFICMLAYYLLWHLNRAMEPIYKDYTEYTHKHIIDVMKNLQKFKMTIAGIVTDTVMKPTKFQQEIIDAVSVTIK